MDPELHLPLVPLAALVASASPGPATLAVAGASLTGVTTGSWTRATAAAGVVVLVRGKR